MKTLAERLKYAMEVLPPKKIKGVELARAVGVKPPSVSDWLSGKSKTMEGENLLRAAHHLNVNPIWLATGKGSPKPDGEINPQFTQVNEWDSNTPVDDDEVEIPFFKDFSFACGDGSFNEAIANERRKLRMSKATLRNLAITESNAVAATASGDSMTPTINDGDTIHIDLGRKEVKDGRIYVICIGGLHYCKRLYNLPFGGIRLLSDNSEEYKEIELTSEERISQQFEIIGWVWQIAKLEKW
ncbi:MAG: peptidase S24 [Shinella sp.]|nr:MAG: peptidase S24 [Shinella sp.]